MSLQLRGHVIIVDEAHNIEDQCRSAASLRLEQTNLNLAKMDCEKLSKLGNNSTSYSAIVSVQITAAAQRNSHVRRFRQPINNVLCVTNNNCFKLIPHRLNICRTCRNGSIKSLPRSNRSTITIAALSRGPACPP